MSRTSDRPTVLAEAATEPPVAVWRALRRPVRFLLPWWPWRCWAYLGSGFVLGYAVLLTLAVCVGLGLLLAVAGVGLLLLTAAVAGAVPLGRLERRRLRFAEPVPVGDPHTSLGGAGAAAWLRTRPRERAPGCDTALGRTIGITPATATTAQRTAARRPRQQASKPFSTSQISGTATAPARATAVATLGRHGVTAAAPRYPVAAQQPHSRCGPSGESRGKDSAQAAASSQPAAHQAGSRGGEGFGVMRPLQPGGSGPVCRPKSTLHGGVLPTSPRGGSWNGRPWA